MDVLFTAKPLKAGLPLFSLLLVNPTPPPLPSLPLSTVLDI
jgi:hypothetical protein